MVLAVATALCVASNVEISVKPETPKHIEQWPTPAPQQRRKEVSCPDGIEPFDGQLCERGGYPQQT